MGSPTNAMPMLSMSSSSGKATNTVVIPLFQGMEALHILRTDIFATLAARPDVRVVLLTVSAEKAAYYQKEFPASERLVYEVIAGYRGGPLERLLGKCKVYLLKTETMDIKRQLRLRETGARVRYYVSLVGNRVLAHRPFRALARWCDAHLVHDTFFKAVFDTYQPSLIFPAHLFADVEIALVREAKRRGVCSIGFINSWDKLTSRCVIRILPDLLIVPNELTKREAIVYHDASPADVIVCGPPQFDVYQKLAPTPRETFCRELGIDGAKRLVLFCPVGRAFSALDWSMIELLDRAIGDGHVPSDLHVLVRSPPNDVVEMRESVDTSRFTFVRPGVRFSSARGVDWDMGKGDQQSLVDDIYHSALVICSFSTMSIDAAILDKPIINLDFDGGPAHRMYERTHYRHILDTGGVRRVVNKEALLGAITGYLAHPEEDAAGRARIRQEQVWKLDGAAGKRVAEVILERLS